MDRFARTIIGYHGCRESFARDLLNGDVKVSDWRPSTNKWDWLGRGIYFWEHSPQRALRWAKTRYENPAVIGAVIRLGHCFDLLDESVTTALTEGYTELVKLFRRARKTVPKNSGPAGKARKLDCLVINDYLARLELERIRYETVRGAFLEGEQVYPGAGFFRETHIQVAVRNSDCILGVFRPNF